jgi:hypothetical protein
MGLSNLGLDPPELFQVCFNCFRYVAIVTEIWLVHIFNFLFFGSTGFAIVRQVFYCLSHTSSPFFSCFGYFGDRVSVFVQTSLDCNSPILCFHHCWYVRHAPSHPACFMLRWSLTNFFAQASLKPQSSWPQPPKYLGLQVRATGAHFNFFKSIFWHLQKEPCLGQWHKLKIFNKQQSRGTTPTLGEEKRHNGRDLDGNQSCYIDSMYVHM